MADPRPTRRPKDDLLSAKASIKGWNNMAWEMMTKTRSVDTRKTAFSSFSKHLFTARHKDGSFDEATSRRQLKSMRPTSTST